MTCSITSFKHAKCSVISCFRLLIESTISDIRIQLASIASVITSVIPHPATKADVNELRAEIAGVRAEVHAREALLLTWLIGTLIASMALACTIAKVVR